MLRIISLVVFLVVIPTLSFGKDCPSYDIPFLSTGMYSKIQKIAIVYDKDIDYQVWRWEPYVRRASIPWWISLTLIDIESGGDPYARRAGSQYTGILQIGRSVARDLGYKSPHIFMGDVEKSVHAFEKYLNLYSSMHHYDPERIAILWKGGPGTLQQWNRSNNPFRDPEIISMWEGSLLTYIRRFRNRHHPYKTLYQCTRQSRHGFPHG
jgi:hypothetical protein